jgi:N-acetylglucosaminyldiphosphoundecaprenol N-acetyl-beta-D-mannosaminyltransferase
MLRGPRSVLRPRLTTLRFERPLRGGGRLQFMYDNETIVGVPISALPLRATLAVLATALDGSRPFWFACVNPHSVETSRRDAHFAAALAAADLNTADGAGIVVASRLLGGRIRERVCGPDLFSLLCARLDRERPGTRMFFLGATRETLADLVRRFESDFPNLVVAGTMAPPFKPAFSPEDDAEMVDIVNAARADVLWIGLGAPKQEKLAHRLCNRLRVRLIAPVGGVFDFYTRRVKLPPRWIQRAGLIWLYRLCQEPRRLLRRNLDAPLFLFHVARQRFGSGSS